MIGAALVGSNVTVNASTPDYRRGEYFQRSVNVGNIGSPVWQNVTVSAGAANQSGNVFVASSPEAFTYDIDGNLLTDGRWRYTWDGANRLISMVSRVSVGSQLYMSFDYDHLGRRIRKRVWNNTTGSGAAISDIRYIYDGWNLIAEFDGNNADAIVRNYIWGLDVSNTRNGAGGVGGLLLFKPAGLQAHYVACDGRGDVIGLVSASVGTNTANYAYGPFGELIRSDGAQGAVNPFRYSSKYQDIESDLIDFGYRVYNYSTGKWLNRDLSGEADGPNLNAFVRDRPLDRVDRNGLDSYSLSGPFGSTFFHNGQWIYQPQQYAGPSDPTRQIGAFELGLNYLTGGGQSDLFFKDGDYMTESLKRSGMVNGIMSRVAETLRAYCKSGGNGPAPILPGLGGELGNVSALKYALWTFPKSLLLNPPEAFTGSFSGGNVELARIDCKMCSAGIIFHAFNRSGAASNTRYPPALGGYSGRASLISNLAEFDSINVPTLIYSAINSSSVLPDNPYGTDGPLRTITQYYEWKQDVKFKDCCQ